MESKLLLGLVIGYGTAMLFLLLSIEREIRHSGVLMTNLIKHIIGDADDPDSTIIKPSLKELIVNRCLEIENELARIRVGIYGEEEHPAIDGKNLLKTLTEVRDLVSRSK